MAGRQAGRRFNVFEFRLEEVSLSAGQLLAGKLQAIQVSQHSDRNRIGVKKLLCQFF
jgi:hypothetical protein